MLRQGLTDRESRRLRAASRRAALAPVAGFGRGDEVSIDADLADAVLYLVGRELLRHDLQRAFLVRHINVPGIDLLALLPAVEVRFHLRHVAETVDIGPEEISTHTLILPVIQPLLCRSCGPGASRKMAQFCNNSQCNMETEHLIVCIDDDKDDIEMLKEAFRSLPHPFTMIEAHDGIEGLDTLRQMYAHGGLPCLIVLDINMPRMDGRETFNAIRQDPQLSDTPIVIFSTSNSPMDQMFFERKNAAYFVKPINFQKLIQVASDFLGLCSHRRTGHGPGAN
ncbi:MAG: response regulator [Chitinophagaceae bacterium]|nr:MAG: response regulator [Chitinophagaceae bacterium]